MKCLIPTRILTGTVLLGSLEWGDTFIRVNPAPPHDYTNHELWLVLSVSGIKGGDPSLNTVECVKLDDMIAQRHLADPGSEMVVLCPGEFVPNEVS